MLIAMLDRLRQGERLWDNQPQTPLLAGVDRLAIGAQQDASIAVPPITEPRKRAPMGALDGGGNCFLKQVLAQ
jgi:hypothetical protein